jgi:Na+/melibiose symporter-like transporter
MLAEELPIGERASGQGRAGLAFAAASSLPLLAVSVLAERADRWRLVWLIGVLPALGLPWLWNHVRDTEAWRAAVLRGETRSARLGDVFRGAHRATTFRLLVAMVLVSGVDAASRAWLFYHPVRGLGLDPRQAAVALAIGGGAGMLGFRSGAWLSDRFGRRLAFSISAIAMAVGVAGYFGAESISGRGGFVRLTASLALLAHAGNAASVAFRSIVAEMMPTCLRGSIGGWLSTGAAFGWLAAMSAIAAFTPILGGIGPSVVAVVCVALPTACLVLMRLPETAGVELEVAASPSVARPSS